MSELDFLLNRKKSTPVHDSEEKREEVRVPQSTVERKERQAETVQSGEKREENQKNVEEAGGEKEESREKNEESTVEEIMASFLDKDPKIGVWSYPAFLVLQYLYNTKPGFKMSRVAKEALEMGLRQMYPELFKKAEEVYRERMGK